jgi:hypothetical protein
MSLNLLKKKSLKKVLAKILYDLIRRGSQCEVKYIFYLKFTKNIRADLKIKEKKNCTSLYIKGGGAGLFYKGCPDVI